MLPNYIVSPSSLQVASATMFHDLLKILMVYDVFVVLCCPLQVSGTAVLEWVGGPPPPEKGGGGGRYLRLFSLLVVLLKIHANLAQLSPHSKETH